MEIAKFIPWLPLLAAILSGICCMKRSLRDYASWIVLAAVAASFGLSLMAAKHVTPESGAVTVHFFEWIHAGSFKADFSYYFDTLTIIMLFVVTGIGSLVVWYAGGYMAGDKGYARFFFAVGLFIFSMTSLVMGDNLLIMFLGWEGVGLCSYLLIGYYYEKPSAVAAGKKAFIVNRIGDLGFVLGIFLTFKEFGSIQYAEIFSQTAHLNAESATTGMKAIPYLLMLGAFGKSAQIPLYVWLPDAMEGPTPVSALIHAATMVTAGVYMIARMMPVFLLSEHALTAVATVGATTALFAGSIALCQYDIKRVWAYSTVSQLGYMFLGVGVASSVGGVFHLFTHAFFKALLFLTAGSVMHAMTGQLDMRNMGGLRKKMPVTCWLMFIGCLALAGFPLTAGFFSKDLILGDAMAKGISEHNGWIQVLAWSGILTAFMTAYYTFRLWFRVFCGPEHYVMGDDHHGDDDGHGDDHGHGHDDHHHHAPHEMPFARMNLPLCFLAVGAIAGGFLCHHWMQSMVNASSANTTVVEHVATAVEHAAHAGEHDGHVTADTHADAGGHGHGSLFGMDIHKAVMIISIIAALAGIALAAYFHLLRRELADKAKQTYAGVCDLLENKYWIDELYDTAIVRPLKLMGDLFFVFDRLVINGIVALVGFIPRLLGITVRHSQTGVLQGYGLGMVLGLACILLLVTWMLSSGF
ncbi:MAG: NADH-quinone oxidoreductase subunit L [Phycisphaeraceae bacterium JB051]